MKFPLLIGEVLYKKSLILLQSMLLTPKREGTLNINGQSFSDL